MKHTTWQDIDCLIVPAIVTGRCSGCVFRNRDDDECPHTDRAFDVSCEMPDSDIIYIKNTPEAIAEYALRRLEGA